MSETRYTPQAYPLYAMAVTADRFDLDPELNRDPVEPIGPAEVCMVIGWETSDGVDEALPVLAWIDTQFMPGTLSPIYPTAGTYYELRLALPTEADRTHFAQQVAESVQAELARKRRKG